MPLTRTRSKERGQVGSTSCGAFAAALAAASLGVAAPAAAGDLVTPPVYVPTGWTITCTLTNVGSKPIQAAEVATLDEDGDAVTSLSVASLEPGEMSDGNATPAAGFYHCRGIALKKNAIVTACSRPDQQSPCETQTTSR